MLPSEVYKGEVLISFDNGCITGKGSCTGTTAAKEFTVLPAEYTITYDLSGGTYNGDTGPIVRKYDDGTKIKLLDAPSKAGYIFDYWRDSEYKAGADYTVTGDHTFTAVWRDIPPNGFNPSGSGSNPSGGGSLGGGSSGSGGSGSGGDGVGESRTSDALNIAAWAAVFAAAALAAVFSGRLIAKKKRREHR